MTRSLAVGILLALAPLARGAEPDQPSKPAKTTNPAKPANPAKKEQPKPIDPYTQDLLAPKKSPAKPGSDDQLVDPFAPGVKTEETEPVVESPYPSQRQAGVPQPPPYPQYPPQGYPPSQYPPPPPAQYPPQQYPSPYPQQYPPPYPQPYPPGQYPYEQQPYPTPYYPVPPPGAYPYGQPTYPPPAPPEEPPSTSRTHFLLRLSLGFGYRWALGESMYGAHLEAMVGAENKGWGGGGQLGFLLGRTQHHLDFQWIHLGPGFLFHVTDRVRIGVGAKLGWLVIQRATRNFNGDDEIWSMSLGIHGEATVDLWRTPRGSALVLGARLGYDYVLDVVDLSPHSLLASLFFGYQI